MTTINSLREDLRRHQAEVDCQMLGIEYRPRNPYKPRPMIYPPSMRNEQDVFFQISMMDWMIGFSLAVLVVVVCVGV